MADLPQQLINETVIAAHHDLDKVRANLAEHPGLLNASAEWNETPVQAAAHVGNRAIAEFLLQQGAPLDICTAAMLGRTDAVRAMLEADPNAKDAVGAHNLPLMLFPVAGGQPEIAELVYAAGASVNAQPGAMSPLHMAAMIGNAEFARWLLERGADKSATDMNGKSPLEVAIENGQSEVVLVLQAVGS